MAPSVRIIKRAIDLLVAFAGLAVTLPLYPIIIALIYLDSPGPPFDRGHRIGHFMNKGHGPGQAVAEFHLLRFRTIRGQREADAAPRVTRVGRLLRRTRLDALPYLLAVLQGHLSLVGPRPRRPELIERLAAEIPSFTERLCGVKPGMTGLAQVSVSRTAHAHANSSAIRRFKPDGTQDAPIDEMEFEMHHDFAYAECLGDLSSYLPTELAVLVRAMRLMGRARSD
jgi:lipopolysaccharide/colanic/teichoic acid biosynthesis glycosyltransferase